MEELSTGELSHQQTLKTYDEIATVVNIWLYEVDANGYMSFMVIFNDGTYATLSLQEAMEECPIDLGVYLESRMLEMLMPTEWSN